MDKRPIVLIPREFIAIGGDLLVGLLLSQIYWWETHSKKSFVESDGFRWIAKTSEEIKNETGLTKRRQRRASPVLKQLGLIETRIMKRNGTPMNHWRLKRERLECLFSTQGEQRRKRRRIPQKLLLIEAESARKDVELKGISEWNHIGH